MIQRRKVLAQLGALSTIPVIPAATSATTVALPANTMVRWMTNVGPIDLQLYDSAAPLTVANFLGYLHRGAYENAFFHRSVKSFVIQGGGYSWSDGAAGPVTIPTVAPVRNEFDLSRSNVRGTIAMAKLGGQPDSATDQWFVNLADNSATLDAGRSSASNGGFTVFGRVTAGGMVVCDQIAALRTYAFASPFGEIPLLNYAGTGAVTSANVVRATSVSVLPRGTDSDRIFNYLEGRFPQYVPATGRLASTGLGYDFRYYPLTDSYVGTKDGKVDYLVPAISPDIRNLGTMAEWLVLAAAEGY